MTFCKLLSFVFFRFGGGDLEELPAEKQKKTKSGVRCSLVFSINWKSQFPYAFINEALPSLPFHWYLI